MKLRRLTLPSVLGLAIGVLYGTAATTPATGQTWTCEDEMCIVECNVLGCEPPNCLPDPEKQCAGSPGWCVGVWCPL